MNLPRGPRLPDHSPRDLRERDGRAGNLYPVDPAAVARLKRILAEREKSAPAQAPKRRAGTPYTFRRAKDRQMEKITKGKKPFIHRDQAYPPEVIAAAERLRQESPSSRRNMDDVFTPEVCAFLWGLKEEFDLPFTWLARNNQLLQVTDVTMAKFMKRYPPGAVAESQPVAPAMTATEKAAVDHARRRGALASGRTLELPDVVDTERDEEGPATRTESITFSNGRPNPAPKLTVKNMRVNGAKVQANTPVALRELLLNLADLAGRDDVRIEICIKI